MGQINELLGKTLTNIDASDTEIYFLTDAGEKYRMYHSQDCCESVSIEDICGDLEYIIGITILVA